MMNPFRFAHDLLNRTASGVAESVLDHLWEAVARRHRGDTAGAVAELDEAIAKLTNETPAVLADLKREFEDLLETPSRCATREKCRPEERARGVAARLDEGARVVEAIRPT